MIAVVALAVNIHGAFGATADGFALSYGAIRGVLILKYVRAYRAVSDARPLTRRYAIGFGAGAGIWAVSTLVSPPTQIILWGLGLAVSFSTVLTAGRHHIDFAPHHEHLPERFGLFTIIVLGESFIGVVGGVAGRDWTISAGLIAAFGVALAFSLWWIYFEHVGSGAIEAAERLGKT